MSIVNTNIPYNSSVFNYNLKQLLNTFSFLRSTIIGYSVLRTPIYAIQFGVGKKHVFYSASYHANEWITSPVLMKFIEDLSNAYVTRSKIFGYSAYDLYNDVTIHFCPMVNPDGVDLVTGYFSSNSSYYGLAEKIAYGYATIPFPDGWKANIRGVDLNLQFPAEWYKAREIKFEQGFTSPAPRDFVGFGPLTEPEALAVYNYALSYPFSLILAYHTQGKEIYWKFQDYLPENSYEIGKKFADVSGYVLSETPYNSSFAGFKDWFIQNFNRPRLYYRGWFW